MVPLWFVLVWAGVTFLVGFAAGVRGITLLRIQIWEQVDNLIHLVQEVRDLTTDGRIGTETVLSYLYKIKQDLRIPKKHEHLRERDSG